MLILAPMYEVTDTVFRQIITDCAPPDLFVTEFVNVDGLQSAGRQRLLPYLLKEDGPVPVLAQIWGQKPANYYRTAMDIKQLGFAGVDINMGCPDRRITNNNCCSALAKPANRPLAAEIIAAVRQAVSPQLPVSVKIRLGWSKTDFSWPRFLLEQKIDMLTIHGRTTADMSRVPARWQEIKQVRRLRDELKLTTKIVGNGDVTSRSQALDYQHRFGVDGVMIGRAIFKNPFLFGRSIDWWQGQSPPFKINLFRRHLELFNQTYPAGERSFAPLKKFMKVYLTGFEGSKQIREQISRCLAVDEAKQILKKSLNQFDG